MPEFMRPPLVMDRITDVSVKRRFVKHLLIVGPGSVPGCWLWMGHRDEHGYGKMKVGGRVLLTHRVSYAMYVGPIPEGMTVHHKYTPPGHEGPLCYDVNPENLELMAFGDNHREGQHRNGHRGAVRASVKKKLLSCDPNSGDVETYLCERCHGTMVLTGKSYTCMHCDRVLRKHEVKVAGGPVPF